MVTRRVLAMSCLGLLLALAGCAGEPPGDASSLSTGSSATGPTWQEPAAYSFVVQASCGERAFIGRFHVTVANGQPTVIKGLDEAARQVPAGSLEPQPTLGNLLREVDRAREQRAHVARVEFDPVDGHPTSVDIDMLANAIDDEQCYRISGYTVSAGG